MIDEISDDQDGLGARKTGDIFIDCLKDPEYRDSSRKSENYASSDNCSTFNFRSFRKRFYEKLRPRSAERFIKHIEDYINAFVLEAHLREKGDILDFASYPALRRNNCANHISFDFVAFGLDLDLPDELFEDPGF
ncbi:hypothetical protein J3R82DRAFT_11472 [Butyriboletus roseoflavus]|nr:hypothetical protein J3R82DRAFT_11472 [Butyriboletus roseoflavus]